jgi:hypothetical protein
MLKGVFTQFDKWLVDENKGRKKHALALLKCEAYVIGQAALLEARLAIHLAATMDVDFLNQLHGKMREKLDTLLAKHGKKIDPMGHEAWMPQETQYNLLFDGKFAKCFVAQPEYVLVSKAIKAPEKNMHLIIEYLGGNPTELFFELVKKYGVDLEGFLK